MTTKPAEPETKRDDDIYTAELPGGVKLEMVRVPKGTFWMSEDGKNAQQQVEIKEDFYIGKYEVTQEQWQAVMGENPSYFSRTGAGRDNVKDISDVDLKRFPVEAVSREDVQDFLNGLNGKQLDDSRWVYRLPTEVEWEYACRGGAQSKKLCSFDFYFGQPTNNLSSVQANFDGNHPAGNASKGPYLERTTKVGSFKPNALGVHNMHGNAWEWCQDWKGEDPYRAVFRGGSYCRKGRDCRAADRLKANPSSKVVGLGFRLARSFVEKRAEIPPSSQENSPPKKVPATNEASELQRDDNSSTVELPGGVKLEMVRVPKGTFWMSEADKNAQKQVEIKEDFYIGKYEVTQEQWEAVMGDNPSYFSRTGGGKDKVKDIPDADLERFPVEQVSWEDVQEFLKRLNEKNKGSGWLYRLPTEAEWEFTCRGGLTSKEQCSFDFYFAQPTNDLSSTQANFNGNFPAGNAAKGPYLERSTKVGSYEPNALGVYDMHGNVWEWTSTEEGSIRVVRGGGWFISGGYCRAAYRHGSRPSYGDLGLGFRLALSSVEKQE